MKRALITGITGQDGSYLAELLLGLGYEVHGTIRRSSADLSGSRIGHLLGDEPAVTLHVSDLGDAGSIMRLIDRVRPDEVYHLAAQSNVSTSFDQPEYTANVTAVGTTRLLEALRNWGGDARFYQASSSEMFGSSPPPQDESTPFHPRSPYAVAKVYAYWSVVNYREAYGTYACNGISFNHESPRRGREYVTRKITDGVARIAVGEATELRLGNLDVRRDWAHARDVVAAMHRMLQLDEPTDFVIGTGESHSVAEFAEAAFEAVGLDWREHVVVDERLYRPADVPDVRCDPSKARELLGWGPQVSFDELVREMVEADLARRGVSLDGRQVTPPPTPDVVRVPDLPAVAEGARAR